jgi:predicted ATPase/DNA-binding NarL/FixJ family response regulator/transcriptional regulator with XRE-family HTH domain
MLQHDTASFGERLRTFRVASGVTQQALASAAGLSARGISDLERGARRAPHAETVRRLADGLQLTGVDRAELLAASRRARSPTTATRTRTRRDNLPTQLTSFVGRHREVAAVQRQLTSTRLLTLTGPGGVGKTRLALQVAARLGDTRADGIWLVELASVTDSALIAQRIAAACGIGEQPGRAYSAMLGDVLQSKDLVLVLDNCEHVLDACATLANELLQTCPRLTCLATSREPLNVSGEVCWAVPAMSISAPTDGQPPSDAVQLFVERARSVRADFDLTRQNALPVTELCRRLDGLPLAIELAAARIRSVPVGMMLDLLESAPGGLPLLAEGPRGTPERQRTLRATIAWSYELLDTHEQTLFRRLGVFRGASLAAIDAVCVAAEDGPGSGSIALAPILKSALDATASLVSKSLLRMEEDDEGQARYSMLETVREFALEQLELSAEASTVRRRHALFFMRLAERIEPDLYHASQIVSLNRLELEHVNFRIALEWCRGQGYAEPSFRLALGLWMYWSMRGHVAEGSDALESLLKRFPPRGAGDPRLLLQARARDAAGRLAGVEGDFVRGRAHLEEALELMQTLESATGIVNALDGLAILSNKQGDVEAARAYLDRELAVAQAFGAQMEIGNALYHLGALALDLGELGRARSLLEECKRVHAQVGEQRACGFADLALGRVESEAGNLDRAREHSQEGLLLLEQYGDPRAVALARADLGSIATAARDFATAHEQLTSSLRMHEVIGDAAGVAMVLDRFAVLASAQRQSARAVRLAAAAVALREKAGAILPAKLQRKVADSLESSRRALGPELDRLVAAGRALSSEAVIGEALEVLPTAPQDQQQSGALSQRELEVATLVARGRTNRQIASQLVIAEATVASHMVHILTKLGLDSRAQVAVWAARTGFAD